MHIHIYNPTNNNMFIIKILILNNKHIHDNTKIV